MKNKPRSQYEILYDRYNEEYVMAEVFYYSNGKVEKWVKINIKGATLWRLSGTIEKAFTAYINTTRIKRIGRNNKLLRSYRRKK